MPGLESRPRDQPTSVQWDPISRQQFWLSVFNLRFQFSLFLNFPCGMFFFFFFPIELCVVLLWSIEGGLISLLGGEGSTLSLWWNGLEVGGCWPTCVLLRCSLGECPSLTPSCLRSAGCWSRVPVYLHRQSLFTPSHVPPHLHTKPESGLHFLFFLSFIFFYFYFFFLKEPSPNPF